MNPFHGLSAFSLTPTDKEGRVQADLLVTLLDRIRAAGADSIGLLGSTGGYAYLTPGERQRAVEAATEAIGGQLPIIVGVGALRTDDAQSLARHARKDGADGLLLAPVSYTPLTEEEVFQHTVAVAEASELPLCLYNNPGTTKFTFGDDLIVRLADVPNIAAVKMPLPAGGDIAGELARLRSRVPDGFAIGYSGDWGAADALLAGCDAWYSVVAGLLPEPALKLVRAARAGQASDVRRIDDGFQPLWTLFREYGSFRVMHMIAELLGLGVFQPPRPILPLPEAARPRVAAALEGL